ncbi:MAG: Fic family protein, partial [Bryobacteraceae bacterium]
MLSLMIWNWQNPDWPKFTWDQARLATQEQRFLVGAGVAIGLEKHLGPAEAMEVRVELLGGEAVTTSAIEGEMLNRASVQSSLQRQLGLAPHEGRRATPAEEGIAGMMIDLYQWFAEPLTEETLFHWHGQLMAGRGDLVDVERYRTVPEAMQIVSGPVGAPRVHFEAPPATRVPGEMRRFIDWFNRTAPGNESSLPALARAGTAHLYFESIHPFEDGNGRIGRAVAEKAMAQSHGQAVVTALATTILAHRKSYYEALERANRRNEITEWLAWFAGIALEAQGRSQAVTEFILGKTRLLDRLRGQINERQQKA